MPKAASGDSSSARAAPSVTAIPNTTVVASTIASRGSRAGLADSDDTEVLSESDPKRASPRF